MKLQAHLPTFSIGPRDRHAAMIALVSLFGAAALLLALQSAVLLSNPLLERPQTSPTISVPHRNSLDLRLGSHPMTPWERFSVAHPLPANAALSQQFSIGIDARVLLAAFGEAAHRDLLAEKGTVPELKTRDDRLILMWMLLHLDTRHG